MGRTRVEPNKLLLDPVVQADKDMKLAHENYKRAQDRYLVALRAAREGGETLQNLADVLQCSKQWIHKFATYGHDHNKVGRSAGDQIRPDASDQVPPE